MTAGEILQDDPSPGSKPKTSMSFPALPCPQRSSEPARSLATCYIDPTYANHTVLLPQLPPEKKCPQLAFPSSTVTHVPDY